MTPLDGPCCEQHFINKCNVKYKPYGPWGPFLGHCTLKLITLSLWRLRRAGSIPNGSRGCWGMGWVRGGLGQGGGGGRWIMGFGFIQFACSARFWRHHPPLLACSIPHTKVGWGGDPGPSLPTLGFNPFLGFG